MTSESLTNHKRQVGTLFNIQRFSTHDGPGIRTTVFFKGCSNRCSWCHNPESIYPTKQLQLFPELCTRCTRCVDVCPNQAQVVEPTERKYDSNRCTLCGACVAVCYTDSLVMAGIAMDVPTILDEVRKDRSFYEESGGGITVSGGEPVLQHAFLLELLTAAKSEGIHTVLETAGNYPYSHLEKQLPYLDLVLYDLKLATPTLSTHYIGNDGHRIFENLRNLAQTKTPIAVRTPVIGGVNDNPDEIRKLAQFIGDLKPVEYYELMPYHRMGIRKRLSLGWNAETNFSIPEKGVLKRLANIAREYVEVVKPEE